MLGATCLMEGEPQAALAPLSAAAAGGDDPATRTYLARALAQTGRIQPALDLLRQVTTAHPAFPQAWLELGDRLREQGRLEEALGAFDTGLQAAPRLASLHLGRAYANLALGRPKAAAADIEEAGRLAPGRLDVSIARGRLFAANGDHAAAILAYREAIGGGAAAADVRMDLSRSLLALGRRDEGEAALREARVAGAPLARLARILADAPHGRLFLRREALERFLSADG